MLVTTNCSHTKRTDIGILSVIGISNQ